MLDSQGVSTNTFPDPHPRKEEWGDRTPGPDNGLSFYTDHSKQKNTEAGGYTPNN